MQNNPIGIFDSGFGGLTVMRAIRDLLPSEDIIYFGDTARLPYGNKSPATVTRYAIENSCFLLEKQVKLLVVACHTASSMAFEALQEALPIPIIGISHVAIEELSLLKEKQKVAILGTRGTISSEVYQKSIKERYPHLEIKAVACPLFVPLVEEGFTGHDAAYLIAKEYLHTFHPEGIDAALLACTHYPLLKEVIQTTLGPTSKLIDPSIACARMVKKFLDTFPENNTGEGNCQFFVTDNPEKFQMIGHAFLGEAIKHVELATSKSFAELENYSCVKI